MKLYFNTSFAAECPPRLEGPELARKKGSTLTKAQRVKCTPKVNLASHLTRFLEAYSQGNGQKAAAQLADISLQTIWRHRKTSPEFKLRFDEADELFTSHMEAKAEDLAMSSSNYAPTMLIFMLKSRRPERYRDNVKVEHSGNVSLASEFTAAMEAVPSGIRATH